MWNERIEYATECDLLKPYRPKVSICAAISSMIFASYPRVYRACLTCGRAMHRRSRKSGRTGYEPGRCRHCRETVEVICVSCFAPAKDLSMVGHECLACWLQGEGADAMPIFAESAS